MIRSLPPLNMGPSLDARAPSPLPPLGHDISRPSSASTQASNALHYGNPQPSVTSGVSLPGLSALASVASGPSPQPMRSFSAYAGMPPNMNFAASPTPTSAGQGTNPPICQNCQTSTTPLWRRDEVGSVLCNACGLFLKLHGRPRPISLKTDVIKSRNRVKSSGPGQKKKPAYISNGLPTARSEGDSPPMGFRRVSHKSNGSDRSNSPVSRTATPGMYHHSNIAPPHMFESISVTDPAHYAAAHSPSLPPLHHHHQRQPSPMSAVSLPDRHLELPQSYEHLQAQNTTLKTKASELEVINGLYKERITELERNDVLHRQAFDQAQLREADLRRRLEDLERQLRTGAPREHSPDGSRKRSLDAITSDPYPKRARQSDASEYSAPPA